MLCSRLSRLKVNGMVFSRLTMLKVRGYAMFQTVEVKG